MTDELAHENAKEIMIKMKCAECAEGLSSSECQYCRFGENGRVFKETVKKLKGE